MVASSSSIASSEPQKDYDVFINFEGEDVRIGFLSHLKEALGQKGILAFEDEMLDRGENITLARLKTIEDNSYVSIVIFSENYAFSPCCLDELVKIIDCMKSKGRILPVFYRVNPTHVQDLTGGFGDAIAKHRQEFKCSLNRVEGWCQALKEISLMAGFVSDDIKCDSKLIEEIVNWILKKLNYLIPSVPWNNKLVGIDSRAEHVESLLCLKEKDVRVVGVCGMGGIGKTTIAKEVLRRIKGQFSSSCFVENVIDKLEQGTESLKMEILSELSGSTYVNKGWLSRNKVLIILDDVSDSDKTETLIGNLVNYHPGSRIIITGRDKQVLRNMDAEMYEVEKLNDFEAYRLFNLHAFKQIVPIEEYIKLSNAAVKYAQGIPLALKVLGSNLYKKSVEEWEDELRKLESTSDDKIQRVLRRSYDGLSKDDKEIFLDIACFFNGEDKKRAVDIMDVPGSKIGISRLADKCLISVEYNKLHMHGLLKQMGKDIINEEKKVKKRRWLSSPQDIKEVLTRAKGTEEIKGILFDMSKIRGLELSPTAFEGMYKLRVLKFFDPHFDYVFPSKINVFIPSGLKFFSEEQRFLYWDGYPFRSLPSAFCAKNLVEVHLQGSRLKELWNGVQQLEKLKLIDLSGSKVLERIPDLSKATNLEVLKLGFCASLVEIPSLQRLSKLKELDLSYCDGLCQHHQHLLRNFVQLASLNLSGWSSIAEFPSVHPSITHLNLSGTGIREVPSSIECLSRLSLLNLGSCEKLESLPNSICNLKYLESFNITKCVNLHELPENFGNLKSLKYLFVSDTAIKKLPSSFNQLSKLTYLMFNRCEGLIVPSLTSFPNLVWVSLEFCGLSEFPEGLSSLELLEQVYLGGNDFESIFENIKDSKMSYLDLSDCKRLKHLPELPTSISGYLVRNCECLKSAAILSSRIYIPMDDDLFERMAFKFDNCINLDPEECYRFLDHLLAEFWESDQPDISSFGRKVHPLVLRIPGSELPKSMIHKNNDGSLLDLSFRQPQCHFTLCAVFDPNVFHGELARIGCTAHCKDVSGNTEEYELDYILRNNDHSDAYVDDEYDFAVFHSEHVFLWRCHQYIPWENVVFQFFAEDLKAEGRSYDAIVKCAVQTPLEKEEPSLKRMKHSEDEATP